MGGTAKCLIHVWAGMYGTICWKKFWFKGIENVSRSPGKIPSSKSLWTIQIGRHSCRKELQRLKALDSSFKLLIIIKTRNAKTESRAHESMVPVSKSLASTKIPELVNSICHEASSC